MSVRKDAGISDERPRKRAKVEESPTKVVNPYTPFRREDGGIRETSWTSPSDLLEPFDPVAEESHTEDDVRREGDVVEDEEDVAEDDADLPPPQIFASLNFYINGSTYPLSDHALKHLITAHGGNISIAMGRRTVTHVIVGKPNGSGSGGSGGGGGGGGGGGSGGGLAGSKIQKEISSTRGKGIKFISAEWVSESVKAGKRLPESRFVGLRLAPKGVSGIQTMFRATVGKK
jgi:hypothetical protein